jgi:hypothetical protein
MIFKMYQYTLSLLLIAFLAFQSLTNAESRPGPLPFIRVAPDNWTFECIPSGARFIPFGSNLIITKPGGNNDEHALDLLTGEKWNPELVRRAFEAAQSLNMNVLKVFLPIWQTLPDPQPRGQVTLGAMDPARSPGLRVRRGAGNWRLRQSDARGMGSP